MKLFVLKLFGLTKAFFHYALNLLISFIHGLPAAFAAHSYKTAAICAGLILGVVLLGLFIFSVGVLAVALIVDTVHAVTNFIKRRKERFYVSEDSYNELLKHAISANVASSTALDNATKGLEIGQTLTVLLDRTTTLFTEYATRTQALEEIRRG